MTRVLVSCEVREELEELLEMMRRSGAIFSDVIVEAPSAVLAKMDLPSELNGANVRAFGTRSGTGVKLFSKIRGLCAFANRIIFSRSDLLVTGFSMMKHRLFARLLRIKHVAYIRGVVFDAELKMGFSDAIQFGFLGRVFPTRIFASYTADVVLTIGEINRRFLLARGLPPDSICVIGPTWLEGLQAEPLRAEIVPDPRVFFVTVAWGAHGRVEEHNAQLALIRSLVSEWNGNGELILRVHPRDDYDYEADDAFRGVGFDRSLPGTFLSQLRKTDLLVAPLSTLAFEAIHVGRNVAFYSDEVATKAYNNVYKMLDIEPISLRDLAAGNLRVQNHLAVPIFSEVNWNELNGVFVVP